MTDVYVIGTGCTPFGKHADRSFADLAQWAYTDAMQDAGLAISDAQLIEQAWFGAMGAGRYPWAGVLHAHGASGFVPRARTHGQCRGGVRHRFAGLSWGVERHLVRPMPGQLGHGG